MIVNAEILDLVFGPGEGDTPAVRARRSDRQYVRSMDQLAEASPRAKGRVLTAHEALEAYGWDMLIEVAREGAALLCDSPDAAARLVRERRELLRLEPRYVAAEANVQPELVEAIERSARVRIRELERVARVIALDERLVSWRSEAPSGNEDVAVRLRRIGDARPPMTGVAVAGIAEAAWVAATQLRLQYELGTQRTTSGIAVSPNYGDAGYPAYRHGYWLAYDTRERLGLGDQELPCSLRELAEDRLGIPVIQAELGPSIAGVTIEIGEERAIVLNLQGDNRYVFVRRSTLAHELGHLLFDPPRELRTLRVDEYDELDRPPHELADRVEQRANAFAVEFIAPQEAVVDLFNRRQSDPDPVGDVMNAFGFSFTAARYQIWNGLERKVPLESLTADSRRRPDPKWEATEAYTIHYHPIRNLRPSRAGRFSAVVVRAATERLISWDTAVEMLEARSEDEVRAAIDPLADLYPVVFES